MSSGLVEATGLIGEARIHRVKVREGLHLG
jgi:hypothetical protein